jgi:hypothetical protein
MAFGSRGIQVAYSEYGIRVGLAIPDATLVQHVQIVFFNLFSQFLKLSPVVGRCRMASRHPHLLRLLPSSSSPQAAAVALVSSGRRRRRRPRPLWPPPSSSSLSATAGRHQGRLSRPAAARPVSAAAVPSRPRASVAGVAAILLFPSSSCFPSWFVRSGLTGSIDKS